MEPLLAEHEDKQHTDTSHLMPYNYHHHVRLCWVCRTQLVMQDRQLINESATTADGSLPLKSPSYAALLAHITDHTPLPDAGGTDTNLPHLDTNAVEAVLLNNHDS